MAHEYHWPDTRDRAIQAFNGDTPGAALEATIQTHFKEHPGRVHSLIQAIGRRVQDGGISSGWAILRHELEQPQPSNIVATDNHERATQLQLAQHWIHNTGGYIDRETELVDCLFGGLGPLRAWPELQAQLVEQWRRERPRFETAEHDTEARAKRFVELRPRLEANTTHAGGPKEATAHANRVAAEVERATGQYLDEIAPDPEDDQ